MLAEDRRASAIADDLCALLILGVYDVPIHARASRSERKIVVASERDDAAYRISDAFLVAYDRDDGTHGKMSIIEFFERQPRLVKAIDRIPECSTDQILMIC